MKKCLNRIQGELDSLLVLCGDSIRYVFLFLSEVYLVR